MNYLEYIVEDPTICAGEGVIDRAFFERLVKMANYRNRLVHLYWELDKEMTYQFIQENSEDFKVFEKKVVDYLSKQES